MFAAIPLLVLPVLAYNIIALTHIGGFGVAGAAGQLSTVLFRVPMASRGIWEISVGDLVLAAALVVLFIELLKSTSSQRIAILNHSLSMVLFVVCLVEFLLLPAFATSVFFLVSLMVLLDVLAGFIVTVISARRDVDFDAD